MTASERVAAATSGVGPDEPTCGIRVLGKNALAEALRERLGTQHVREAGGVVVVAEEDRGCGEADRATVRDRKVSLLVAAHAGEARIGPMDGGAFAAGLMDLDGRLQTTGHQASTPARSAEWTPAELNWVAAVVAVDLDRHAAGRSPLAAEHLVILDRAELTVTRHRVLPLPLGDSRVPISRPQPLRVADIIDEQTGIITRIRDVEHDPSIPSCLRTVHAHVANMRAISPWMTDPVTAGSAFGDRRAAFGAAIGW